MFSHLVCAFWICAGLIWDRPIAKIMTRTAICGWANLKKDGWAMSSLGPRPRPPLPVARLWLGAPPRTRAACHFFLSVACTRAHRPAPVPGCWRHGQSMLATCQFSQQGAGTELAWEVGMLSRLAILVACCSAKLFSCSNSDMPARCRRC
jgi:hypothetical protein